MLTDYIPPVDFPIIRSRPIIKVEIEGDFLKEAHVFRRGEYH